MGSTSAREQEQTMEGGWLGQESSPTKKLSLFFLLPLSTALNGSNSNHYTFFVVLIFHLIKNVHFPLNKIKTIFLNISYTCAPHSSDSTSIQQPNIADQVPSWDTPLIYVFFPKISM